MANKNFSNNLQSFFIFLLFLGVVLSAIVAPILQKIYGHPAGEQIYSFFWHICHQYPTRSFWVLDHPLAICARCTGGYMGVSLAALILYFDTNLENENFKKIREQRFFFGALFLLIGVLDGLCQALGFYDSGNLARFLSGLIGGAGVFLFIYPGKMNPTTSLQEGV